jgi:hypothetical protein
MKRKLFLSILITFLFFNLAKAQGDEEKIFTKVPVEAGTNIKQWADHVKKSTQLTDSMLRAIPYGIYKVKVQFIVDVHGNVGQIKATNDPGYGLAKKAMSILHDYKGKWNPANQCGRSVKSYKEETIVFIVPEVRQ